MKITLEFAEKLLEPALQKHLETGVKMQDYVRSAVLYFNDTLRLNKEGWIIGSTKDAHHAQKLCVIEPLTYLPPEQV
jgi:hypothetical protein